LDDLSCDRFLDIDDALAATLLPATPTGAATAGAPEDDVRTASPAPPSPVALNLCRYCDGMMEPDSKKGAHTPQCKRYVRLVRERGRHVFDVVVVVAIY
jgi:hypothetical protein